ncbi:hypothetical protein [Arvimicrobium flavum]|uniref:hypothetical protein n=1 Tax=Arvimicrobium flavum TaxID=3393320 RepID=UPI00237A6F64|nr:hypothetical protein [Mesorhizobium shangrilense]
MLMLEEKSRREARQDLLEAIASAGCCAPCFAPTPGVLLELFEIAAMERHAPALGPERAPDGLTSAANRREMDPATLGIGKQLIDGARSFARLAARRLFVRPGARPVAP